MARFKLALIQADFPFLATEENLKKGMSLCEEAADHGAKLVLLPEAFYTGYIGARVEEMLAYAEPLDGPCLSALKKTAQEKNIYIAATILKKAESDVENTAFMIDPSGKVIAEYSKTHLTRWERGVLQRGTKYPVFETPLGRIGMLVCMDISYPEAMGMLRAQGADLILLPAAWKEFDNWRDQWDAFLMVRAMDNGVYLAATNRVGPAGNENFCGHSAVATPLGKMVCMAGVTEETILYQDISTEQIALERDQACVVKNRHPEDYTLINS